MARCPRAERVSPLTDIGAAGDFPKALRGAFAPRATFPNFATSKAARRYNYSKAAKKPIPNA